MRVRLAIAFLVLAVTLPLRADRLRLVGSTTVRGLLEPKQAQLEAAAGATVEFKGTGSVAGLLALMGGAADAAMLSLPLEDAIRAVEQKTSSRVDPTVLAAQPIGEIRTVFLVNPRNPVRSLSAAQLGDVLTGKVTNWKDVGGRDASVLVVSIGNGGSLLAPILGGKPMAPAARVVANATQIAVIVAEQADAIGIVSAAHPRGQTTILQTDANVNAPLLLVTKGAPSAQLQKLVDAARALLAPGL